MAEKTSLQISLFLDTIIQYICKQRLQRKHSEKRPGEDGHNSMVMEKNVKYKWLYLTAKEMLGAVYLII